MASLERKPSITAEELTPIVLNQLQSTNKRKEDARRNKRGTHPEPAGHSVNNNGKSQGQTNNNKHQDHIKGDPVSNIVRTSGISVDSGSESCGEESQKRTAAAFMSGIQSALQDRPDNGHAGNVKIIPNSELSDDLVTEVDTVLSKLMNSVSKGDPSLIPLITTLQSTLKANKEASKREAKNDNRAVENQLRLSNSKSSSFTSEPSPGTPNSAKEWMKDPFGSLPRRPPAQNEELDFAPVHSKTFLPQSSMAKNLSTTSDLPESSQGTTTENSPSVTSQIPWKIQATKKESVRHPKNNNIRQTFTQAKTSMQNSAENGKQIPLFLNLAHL